MSRHERIRAIALEYLLKVVDSQFRTPPREHEIEQAYAWAVTSVDGIDALLAKEPKPELDPVLSADEARGA